MKRLLSLCFRGCLIAWLCMMSVVSLKAESPAIVNGSVTISGKLNAWTARNPDRALSVHVYMDGLDIKANLRQYVLNTEFDIFAKRDTVLTFGGTPLPAMEYVPVKLMLVAGTSATYSMVYNDNGTERPIGWIRQVSGSGGRSTVDVIIRIKPGVTNIPTGTSTGTGTGCDEPPADDMGEEELMSSVGTSNPRVPARNLPLTAPTPTSPPPPPSDIE